MCRAVLSLQERRDPRYDDTAGEFRPDLFMKNYEFLQDANDREQMKMKKVKLIM